MLGPSIACASPLMPNGFAPIEGAASVIAGTSPKCTTRPWPCAALRFAAGARRFCD